MSAATPRFGRIRGVYFDAGGTLLHPHPSVGFVYVKVLKRWGVDLAPEAVEAEFRITWKKMTREARHFTNEQSEKAWWRTLVLHTLHGRLPADFDGFFEDLYVSFAEAEHWRLFDGVSECLGELRRAGIRTGIISNWDHRLRSILRQMDMLAWFDEIIISCEVGVEKPDKAIFLEGGRRWDLEAPEILYVGDSLYHDVEPARRLGWEALLIHQHEPVPDDVCVARDFPEITRLLGLPRE